MLDESNSQLFRENKYLKLEKVLTGQTCALLFEYLRVASEKTKRILSKYPEMYFNVEQGHFSDHQAPGDFSHYGSTLFDTLGLLIQKAVQDATNLELVFTYSYFRLYTNGTELKPHQDRDSCEISVTVCLGYVGEQWPIFMQGKPLCMEPGDMVIYRGCDLEHWREPFKGELQAQAFLHYNDLNGPFRDKNKWDKRPFLGFPKGEE